MTDAYTPKIDRRTAIQWMVATAGVSLTTSACSDTPSSATGIVDMGTPKPISGMGYGEDPSVMDPVVTWERTMTEAQLRLTSALGDTILPSDDETPAASDVGVPDFIDEWVSSPYEMTQGDRERCFALFDWLEGEAQATGGVSFADLDEDGRKAILDRVAWRERVEEGLDEQAAQFNTFRSLAMSAYFASDGAAYWLGYRGNSPSGGTYPGPTQEAREHLAGVLAPLGLTMPKDL